MRNLSLSSTRILISSFVGPTKKIVRNKTLELENVSFFLSFFLSFLLSNGLTFPPARFTASVFREKIESPA